MTASGNILAIAGRDLKAELTSRLGSAVVVCPDPYEALGKIHETQCRAIVLTSVLPELEEFCQAARRLAADARIVALCAPNDEPRVRRIFGRTIDQYYIYPLRDSDWHELRASLKVSIQTQTSSRQLAMDAQTLSALLEKSTTLSALESKLTDLIHTGLHVDGVWIDAAELADEGTVLLEYQTDVSKRYLITDTSQQDLLRSPLLASIQDILPALVHSAGYQEQLHHDAITDYLTGAYNRRYFYSVADQILLRAASQQFRVSVLLYDIDDFKHYNELFGHATGDAILRDIADMMKRITRKQDIVARIGGDEFAVLFWDTEEPRKVDSHPLGTAYELSNRFRQAVESATFESLGPQALGQLSISGGLAGFPSGGTTIRQLLRQADRALRQAKSAGKNRISLIDNRTPRIIKGTGS